MNAAKPTQQNGRGKILCRKSKSNKNKDEN